MSVFGFDYDEAYSDLANRGTDTVNLRLESLSYDQLRNKLKRMGLDYNRYFGEAARLGSVSAERGASHSDEAFLEELEESEQAASEEAAENATYFSFLIPKDYLEEQSFAGSYSYASYGGDSYGSYGDY